MCYNDSALKKHETGDDMTKRDSQAGYTSVSNCFIDYYLADANDAQIKVYLYLLRMMRENKPTTISDLAEKFNHTEKEVCRCLRYWEQKGLLALNCDSAGNLKGIRMLSPQAPALQHAGAFSIEADTMSKKSSEDIPQFTPFVALMPEGVSKDPFLAETSHATGMSTLSFEKPDYTSDDLRAFKNDEQTAELLFVAEQYLKKTLSANDIRSMLFISDTLGFSNDLIDYLLQYCVERGKKDFRYMEKVAITWAQEGVTTPCEAKNYAGRYDKNVYTIMNALGKTSAPTPKEVDYIKRWNNEYGFTQDIIMEACERTVMATDKHRFEYADKILLSWKNAGVHHMADITAADNNFRKSHSAGTSKKPASNMFNRFQQNDYDFDALEQQLLERK